MSGEGHSWQSIQADVLARIRSRDWPPGTAIPFEAELAETYGCSRATVNRALRELAEAGYLDRRRKAGTRVALNPVRKATLSIPVTRLEIEGRGQAYGYRLLSRQEKRADAAIRRDMDLRRGAPVLLVRALHLADGAPYLYEDRLISLGAVPAVARADLAAVSANEWLVQNAPFTGGSFEFSAQAADADAARALGCAAGTPLFTIDRRTRNGAATVTRVHLSYAPGYTMRTEI